MTMARNDPAYPLRFPTEEYRDLLKEEAKAKGLSLQEYIIELIDGHPHRAFDLERMPRGEHNIEYFWSRSRKDMVVRIVRPEDDELEWRLAVPHFEKVDIDGDDFKALEREYQARFVATT